MQRQDREFPVPWNPSCTSLSLGPCAFSLQPQLGGKPVQTGERAWAYCPCLFPGKRK